MQRIIYILILVFTILGQSKIGTLKAEDLSGLDQSNENYFSNCNNSVLIIEPAFLIISEESYDSCFSDFWIEQQNNKKLFSDTETRINIFYSILVESEIIYHSDTSPPHYC